MGKAFRVRSHPHLDFRPIPVSRPFRRWLLIYTFDDELLRIERVAHTAQDIHRFLG
jgi:hypothetical protein